ncbi:unnamed protein product [Darwinula stevensoni]|uniref:Uncharacterized protein n=1 Tax=Darwinula stevensoni TaxID=69355 RepID=A0A7R9A859_9CRUS|nr:unnamed protein product [Darwinula stevensoni]CAG0895678.1 unnamed protein product [Darwinula stevensoni]
MVEQVDESVGYLVCRLDSLGLSERTNLIFLSDHGMMGIKHDMAVDLESLPVSPDDYLHASNTPLVLIYQLEGRENGVYVPKLKPILPSITFVNHQAIATGLYAETHGILANDIIDPETGELVNMFDDGEKFATADPRIIPIWISLRNGWGTLEVNLKILAWACQVDISGMRAAVAWRC